MLEVLGVCLLLGFLFSASADAFAALYGSTLNPDVHDFLQGARRMSWFYDTGRREPLLSFLQRLSLSLIEDQERALRMVSVVSTLAAALLLHVATRALLGRALALVALALFAINPVVHFYSVSGLREPLQAALSLAFVVSLPVANRASSPVRAGLLTGLLAALLTLTRVYAIGIVCAGLLGWVLWTRGYATERRRNTFVFLGTAGLVTLMLLLPRAFVEADGVVTRDLVYWWNVEQTGAPGDWRTAAPVSLFAFLFEARPFLDGLTLVPRNLWLYVWDYVPFWFRGYEALFVFVPIGALVGLRVGRGLVPLLLLAAVAPVALILHIDQVPGSGGIENRLVYPVFPFALLAMLLGVAQTAALLLRLAARRWPDLEDRLARLERLPLRTTHEDRAPHE